MVAILVAVFYFLMFIAIVVTALARGHYASSSFVWKNNQSFYTGDMPGVSYCVGFATMAFAFTGWSSHDLCAYNDRTDDDTQVVIASCILPKKLTVRKSQCHVP